MAGTVRKGGGARKARAKVPAKAAAGAGRDAGERKKLKSYRLSEAKIAAAQKILGAKTATATIEAALDAVVFRKELVEGTRRLAGLDIVPYDEL